MRTSSCVASGRNRASKLNRYVSEALLTCLHEACVSAGWSLGFLEIDNTNQVLGHAYPVEACFGTLTVSWPSSASYSKFSLGSATGRLLK